MLHLRPHRSCWVGRHPSGWSSPTSGFVKDTSRITPCAWGHCGNTYWTQTGSVLIDVGCVTFLQGATSSEFESSFWEFMPNLEEIEYYLMRLKLIKSTYQLKTWSNISKSLPSRHTLPWKLMSPVDIMYFIQNSGEITDLLLFYVQCFSPTNSSLIWNGIMYWKTVIIFGEWHANFKHGCRREYFIWCALANLCCMFLSSACFSKYLT